MKKITPLIIVFFAGLLIVSLFFRNKFESFFQNNRNFRIVDTASVSRIEIMSEDTVFLTRENGSWLLNGEMPASDISVNNFLFSFQRVSVRGISNLPEISGGNGIRVKIYEGRKKHLLRLYSIDGVSFMHKEGANKLYAVEVSGFPSIQLSEIVSSDPDHWKDRILIDLAAEDIQMVSLSNSKRPEAGFRIVIGDGNVKLFESNGIELPASMIKKEKIDFYLSYFTNVFYDSTSKDSVSPGQFAGWSLKLEDKEGKKYNLQVFPMPAPNGEDMFRALVKYNNEPGYKVTRFMVLDLLLQDLDYFLLNDTGKTES